MRKARVTNSARLARRRLLRAGVTALGTVLLSALARSQQTSPAITTTDLGGFFLFEGAGCNVIAQRGDDGALMIDGGLAANADALLRDLREGDMVTISVFRGDELLRFPVTLHTPPEDTCYLTLAENPSQAVVARRKAWLTGTAAAQAA